MGLGTAVGRAFRAEVVGAFRALRTPPQKIPKPSKLDDCPRLPVKQAQGILEVAVDAVREVLRE